MEVLPFNRYSLALELLSYIEYNTLFAESVLKGQACGNVLTDNNQAPSVFYVVHRYGMSLLFGEITPTFLNNAFKPYVLNNRGQRDKVEWMQIYPVGYEDLVNQTFDCQPAKKGVASGPSINIKETPLAVTHRRVNFSFDYETFKMKNPMETQAGVSVNSLSKSTFANFGSSVAPRCFWRNYHQFQQEGLGLELQQNGTVIAVAFSAFRSAKLCELGMEVLPQNRGQGYGAFVTSRLIHECCSQQLTPVWSCNQSNTASAKLAQKMGFTPMLTLPYYQLPYWPKPNH